MMEAVARRKAHWLFGAGSENTFSGKRRPQEDMVTSAVFGSIRMMSPNDRFKAIELVLGRDAVAVSEFTPDNDIEVTLWKRFDGLKGRRDVEPDILLSSAGKTAIVEVKWHAPLSDRQLEQQVQAVGPEIVTAVIVLGDAGVEENVLDKPAFLRTWRNVSSDLQSWPGDTRAPLGRWVETMRSFLQETDMGRIFNGIAVPEDEGSVTYQFDTSD